MSGPTQQEHSYLKVLYNFQYKTAEGREIIIKKNEPLYLLQKTNADWWQVVRTLEQRSFYVPATYVREVSKTSASSTRKNSEEDREGIFEPPQDPSYKSMPKESSNAMRNVKKWLAGAIDGKPEPPKALYDSEVYQNSDAMDGGAGSRLKVGTADSKTKSLERDRRSGHFSDREDDAVNGSPRSRTSGEYHDVHHKSTGRLSSSPRSSVLPFRMEPALQDPFRRELECSLDRRNLGVKSGAKIGSRIRTRSTNSEGSHVDSDGAEPGERTDRELFARPERRQNLSVHEESPRDSQSSSGTSRNSRSLDFEAAKFALHAERSTSPKPSYGRQMTVAGGNTLHQEKTSSGDAASGDHKILNDKRRTWAVEELMSELTQMCKERGVNKKPAFQLKSTELKANFDPLEKLTREIHEMNRLRTEANAPESDASLSDASPINVCKISINSENSTASRAEAETRDDSVAAQRELATPEETSKVKVARKNPGFSLPDGEPVASSPRSLKSPKSPKILDEYNEANILNDCNSLAGAARPSVARSLSPDKQPFYQKRSNPIHSSTDNIGEQCYSNVKVNAERAKSRPKLKIKTMEPGAELRLTPSLEKLASEIQFLPARRTGQADEGKGGPSGVDGESGEAREEGSKSDDSLERRDRRGILKSLRHKLEYKGSFKTKREEKYIGRERREVDGIFETGRKSGLKKSSTLNCATIPDCYRRFRKNEGLDRFEPLHENSMLNKRRSRSLSDLESLEQSIGDEFGEVVDVPRAAKSKPVPLPRTKIPAVPVRRETARGLSSFEISNVEYKGTTASSSERVAPRTIPEQRKTSRERRDNGQDDDSRQGKKSDYPQFFSLDKYQNHSADVNGRRNVNIESSTAVGFKTLLCASDSGSDNCLQSKELLSSSNDNLNERASFRATRKSSFGANFNDRSKTARESLSDEQILSSNASSEALQSHSESEVTGTLDVSSQPSPVARSGQDDFECSIDLPHGWTQKYDSDTGQICFINDRGDKAEDESEVGCENDHRPIDDGDEREEEIEYDGRSGGREQTCLGRATFDRVYGSLTSAANDSSTTCCFEPKPRNGECSGLSRSLELSGLLFCADDDRALSYCDRFRDEKSEEQPDDLRRSSAGTSRRSESSAEEIGAANGFEDEVCPFDSLEMNLNCDDEPFASDFEIDESCFGATRFSENHVSAWTERFDDRGLPEEFSDGVGFGERFCVSCDRYDCDKYPPKSLENSELSDTATLEENLDREGKTVAHWVANFNNFDGVRKSTESTERTAVHTFNIFNGTNDDEPWEFSDDYSTGFSDTENGVDAGVGPIELGESVEENENVKEYRRRKGSVSSDVVEWKRNLWDMFSDDEECEDEWFSSNDAEGKIYFFEENSNESSWVLPDVETGKSQSTSPDIKNDRAEANGSSTSEKTETGSIRSIILANPSGVARELPPKKAGPAGGDWPHLCDGNNMLILKEGVINRTKITENGKKLRKNWSASYAVLTELFLLFFKDAKTFAMMKTGQSSTAKPDISVDLNGAIVEPGDRASSRKNVYMISTVLGLQVLVQSDNTAVATEWFQEVHGAIRKLPCSFKSHGKPLLAPADMRKTSGGKQPTESNLLEDPKKFSKVARSRSMKMKRLDDSLEDLSGSAAERQTKIKAKLRRFFQRRPAVELLVKNGIYKDEPAFGSYLSDVCPMEPPRVPVFVKTCIEVLESKEENMKTDGLYRASGNLSQIQKIRLQVDQYKLDVLAQEEDVHVLAGALKLFFRELKEPLIPSSFFKEAVNASMLKKSSAKIQCFREIVKALPPPNYDTLQFLLKHLLKVTSYQEFNRMHIPNLAIVFGPTLMWPAEESANMALDFMQQNLVIECLLSEYNKIFK